MSVVSPPDWDRFLVSYPNAHLLQTSPWGELKSAFGWDFVHVIAGNCGAQILFRKLPLGFTIAYIPKGPVGYRASDQDFRSFPNPVQDETSLEKLRKSAPVVENDWEKLWLDVDAICRSRRALALKVEPDQWEEPGSRGVAPPGFLPSPHTIQPPRTITLDLSGSEDQILARMKQKTRYNIRLAEKKGIVIRPSNDLNTWDVLMRQTGERDAFGVHIRAYYQKAYDLFHPSGAGADGGTVSSCELLLAEFEGEPLAAIMVFARGDRAWYFYGASSNAHREKMPAYLLQWEGIRWAREKGCTEYDLWGVPDEEEETLEANFLERSDGLWGVYRFKRGFGGEVRRAAGPWDRVYLPWLYRLYLWRMGSYAE
ncbi:MAG TPA: peptidoglycan bridge formation glycyltransferase FemA/FemB family protein [Anaerolineales bacterium]|nr:peptidoglycan bridge formation glycyltransferase FemA/FemB family protein [Anaerolineales bacterium]